MSFWIDRCGCRTLSQGSWYGTSICGAGVQIAALTADKDRPACIILARKIEPDGWLVVLMPITHSVPAAGELAIEIPPRVAQHLGLDAQRSWVIASEANIDVWPSPDLRPISGKGDSCDYGFLPPRLSRTILERFAEARRSGIAALVDRSES